MASLGRGPSFHNEAPSPGFRPFTLGIGLMCVAYLLFLASPTVEAFILPGLLTLSGFGISLWCFLRWRAFDKGSRRARSSA